MMQNFLLVLLALVFDVTSALPGRAPHSSAGVVQDRVLIVDVDNTLYSEQDVKSRGLLGIEEQIVANTHKFCESMNMTRDEADALFREHGSTIEGVRRTYLEKGGAAQSQKEVEQLMKDFYEQVWSDFDYSSLMTSAKNEDATGYSHAPSASLQNLLRACPYPIYFASNSPARHVAKVKEALGLCKVPGATVAPDTISDEDLPFPTKANPEVFFREIQKAHPQSKLVLIDDSKLNLEKACWQGVEGIHVKNGKVEEALARAIGHIDRDFELSSTDYLKDKNAVDAKSIDRATWEKLAEQIELGDDGVLRITDLGAGLVLMLDMIMNGKEDKPALVELLEGVERIEYHAYESNLGLFRGCLEKLHQLGFAKTPRNEPRKGDTYVFHNAERNIVVNMHWYDYKKEVKREDDNAPHVIVGCCFADLIEPSALVQSLKCYVAKLKNGASPLVYFPITFAGTTQFLPSQPFSKSARGWIPSDTAAFRSYSKALSDDQGHNLDPRQLVEAVERHGGELLQQGRSNWIVEKEKNSYFWKAMLYFFGTVAAPKLMIEGWDSIGWMERAATGPDSIMVNNVDLLFRLDATLSETLECRTNKDLIEVEEIQFTAPYLVETSKKSVDVSNDLLPDQVMIESVCSLISSGTELKIYKGDFEDAALDVNIEGMAEERMSYPLTYGYSSVGRITHVGSGVDPDLVGKLAFTFSPHASHVVTSKDAMKLVPDGIAAEDAIFMPSVETALSLVHDAHVRVGEKVAVYGQGLIGLLVTSILAMQKTPLDTSPGGSNFGTITAFDTIPERLAMSAAMGSSQALLPNEASQAGPFDVSIEVSGNERALQSAIDYTRNGGRIIVGSWYGNSDVTLKLGIDFHRSHKTIKTSQVSEIPAELKTLWSKERRFALTWELVKLLRPSRILTTTVTLESAGEAYESLEKGNDIAVAFRYNR